MDCIKKDEIKNLFIYDTTCIYKIKNIISNLIIKYLYLEAEFAWFYRYV